MLYFIRHAATQGNLNNVWVGRKDEPIANSSLRSLAILAEKISAIQFDCIYSSPLQRAYQTALYIEKKQPRKPILVVEPCLIERDFADFEGVFKSEFNRGMLDSSTAVESMTSIKERLQYFLLPLIDDKKENLIVSHSAVFRCVVNEFKVITKPYKTSLKNLEWVIFLST